ncbi:MAG TPA: hydrogenase [Candidatus Hydrogenedentes bacterium]|nr:hydrogenase [Candidatus Hydrogenedentota bacterium]
MNVVIDTALLALIVSSMLLLGFSQIRSCIRAVAIQGFVLGALPLVAHRDGLVVSTLLLCAVTIALKGVVFPRVLFRFLREADVRREVEPFVGHAASVLVGFLSLAGSVWVCSRFPVFPGNPPPLVVPVSFFMVFVGLFIIVSRKKAVSQILGYLVMENGMYVFGVVVLRDMPLLVDLGVLLDAFAAVFVMGVAVYHITREFEHMDVDQLDTLKG